MTGPYGPAKLKKCLGCKGSGLTTDKPSGTQKYVPARTRRCRVCGGTGRKEVER